MSHSKEESKFAMYESQECCVILVQQELTWESALEFQRNVLEEIRSKNVKGVVIDLSGVNVIDSQLWNVFSKTSQMIKIMGFPSIVTGLSPGAVASIIDHDLNIDEISTALNLEEALSILNQSDEQDSEAVLEIEEKESLEDRPIDHLNNDEDSRE
jgi:rsbT antagonist protein RsbS